MELLFQKPNDQFGFQVTFIILALNFETLTHITLTI